MIAFIWFGICLASLALALVAAGLFVKGQNREQQDAVFSRLKVQGVEDAGDLTDRIESNNPLIRAVNRRLVQAGFEPSESGIMTGLIVLVALAALLWMGFGPGLAALCMLCLLFFLQIYLMNRASKRYRTLCLQLPDFMDRLLRPLIAGNTIEESFAIATRESPEPIRGLFLSVARQVRFGAPLEEAVSKVATIHELTDLHALAMATKVHRRYGGSIRKMVKSLIHMARSRETSVQELRALTAETRMSAWVLVAVPVAITTFILLRNPEYYSAMWSSDTGRIVLLSGFVMQFVGAIVIWRMMRSTGEVKG